jgi:hypothetical protein
MAVKFREKKGYRSAVHRMKHTISTINVFETVVRSLVVDNSLKCRSYRSVRKSHKPVEKVREMYTAKFVYEDAKGKRVGTGSETYNSVQGYRRGIAAVISNMANIASHGGNPRHTLAADMFAVTLRCNDPEHGLYFVSLARNRITVSSYGDDAVLARVGMWADTVPALA